MSKLHDELKKLEHKVMCKHVERRAKVLDKEASLIGELAFVADNGSELKKAVELVNDCASFLRTWVKAQEPGGE